MKTWILALAVAILCGGCGVAKSYLQDTAAYVNDQAFQSKVKAEVVFCDRHKDPSCWKHQGYYYPETSLTGRLIHIAPEWYWEPEIYFQGIIAHEMIHAWLGIRGEANPDRIHDWKFQDERERVAKALDIPLWAIPSGKKGDSKLDATRMMAYLERYMQAQINAVHGVGCNLHTDAGWPTELYDPEDWRERPPGK